VLNLLIEWTHVFATRHEIEKYYSEMAHAYKLNQATSFRYFVRSCVWDENHFEWQVTVDVFKGESTEVQHWISDVVIQCVGQLDRPKFGTTPGLKNFKGKSWHTNIWPKDSDIKGRRVAVIGCGSSAAQIIPVIVDEVEHLTIYMRTPPVVFPRPDAALSGYDCNAS